MNAIVNHLGFGLIESKGIELEEEIVSGHLQTYTSGYELTLDTKKFGHIEYSSVVCLPLEIKIANYRLIRNNKDLIEYVFCNFVIRHNSKYSIYVAMKPSYSSSDDINFEIKIDAKITYLVLPEKLNIYTFEAISCSTDLYL